MSCRWYVTRAGRADRKEQFGAAVEHYGPLSFNVSPPSLS
jgi:hypothetical protein